MDETIENHIVMLLGVKDSPLPSLCHLQKEMFMLSKTSPTVKEIFDFEKHYEGPYSKILGKSVRNLLYHDSVYEEQDGKIGLTDSGKEIFEKILDASKNDKKFDQLIKTLKLIRHVYDKLSKNELLFLICKTYPDQVDELNIFKELNQKENRTKLAISLRDKGLITNERYRELLN